jgi:hypothetical protein
MNPVQNRYGLLGFARWVAPQQHSVPDLVVIGICSPHRGGAIIPARLVSALR